MCNNQKRILELVQLAKKQEPKNTAEAAKYYLQAAKLVLDESSNEPGLEDEYIKTANDLYLKAKELKRKRLENTSPGIFDNEFRQAEITDTDDNKIRFRDIGGLKGLKEEIWFKIIEPIKNPDLYRYYGKNIGGGIIMYGPPGCGKSLIAQATANEADITFMHVKCSDLKSKYVGETEKNIAELFDKAREKQPAIIFFDEFESLGGDRTEAQNYEKSAVSQFLTEMDGIDSQGQQLLLLAATNEPWSIDPALRREGRFGTTIFVPPPDHNARKEIFRRIMRKRPIANLNLDELARLTEGFSGADIKAVCEIATDIPLKESLKTRQKRKISMADMKKAISKTNSVIEQWFAKASEQIKNKKLEEYFKEMNEWKG